ncbi:PepSY domain-containing protein [Agrococcus sp. Ld7]|uniref:PepSY domain-containing protein n=1 Tax=Agrococcus sp. Ld7 TaxID=649148 RepID=UPI0038681285
MSSMFPPRGTVGAIAAIVTVGALVGCASGAGAPADPATTPTAEQMSADPGTSPTTEPSQSSSDGAVDEHPGPNADLRETQLPVSPEDAWQTANDEVGAGFVYGIELDYDETDAAWEWEVNILDGSTDYEIEIDAVSGEIVGQKSESTSDTEEPIDLSDPMTYDEALELATAEVDGPLVGWKLEWDDGMREYQFDLMRGGEEVEVTVDVESGQVTLD